jgi:hypothetical protein
LTTCSGSFGRCPTTSIADPDRVTLPDAGPGGSHIPFITANPTRYPRGRMRIERIEPITALTPAEAELLNGLLGSHPEVDRAALVVYRVRTGDGLLRGLVAPSSPDLHVGEIAVGSGWMEAAQTASSTSPEAVTLQVAERLIAHDMDV